MWRKCPAPCPTHKSYLISVILFISSFLPAHWNRCPGSWAYAVLTRGVEVATLSGRGLSWQCLVLPPGRATTPTPHLGVCCSHCGRAGAPGPGVLCAEAGRSERQMNQGCFRITALIINNNNSGSTGSTGNQFKRRIRVLGGCGTQRKEPSLVSDRFPLRAAHSHLRSVTSGFSEYASSA